MSDLDTMPIDSRTNRLQVIRRLRRVEGAWRNRVLGSCCAWVLVLSFCLLAVFQPAINEAPKEGHYLSAAMLLLGPLEQEKDARGDQVATGQRLLRPAATAVDGPLLRIAGLQMEERGP